MCNESWALFAWIRNWRRRAVNSARDEAALAQRYSREEDESSEPR